MLRHKLLIATAASAVIACSSSAFASDANFQPHPYLGISAGYGDISFGSHIRHEIKNHGGKVTDGGFTGRIFAGYSFTPNISLETGYDYLPNYKISITDGSGKVRTNAVDLLAKANLPLSQVNPSLNGIDVFAKAGMAYVWSKDEAGRSTALRPAYGLGADYNITQNIAVGASWLQIYGDTNAKLDGKAKTPLINTFTGDLAYNFN